jgi:hypothetical protein
MNRNIFDRPGCTLLACVPLLLTACSRDIESSGPTADAVQAIGPADPRTTSPTAQATTAIAIPANDPAATLSALTQAVRKFSIEKRRAPATVEELAAAGYVQAVPPAPAGKTFMVNTKLMVVELANQ